MRRTICVASLAIVLCAALTVTASAETRVTHVNTSIHAWYIKSESPVAAFSEMTWSPDVSGRDKGRRFELASPSATSGTRVVQRETSWRLDEGLYEAIDWEKVRHQLWAKFSIRIGETFDISVPGMTPVRCYRVCGSVYASYSREVYEIHQKGNTAVISVLRPVDGKAVVFETCCALGYRGCDRCAPPASTLGTCASATGIPFNGGSCATDRTGNIRNFENAPPLASDHPVPSTWGKIKAMYRND